MCVCETGNRCLKCRKLNFKRESARYQNMWRSVFVETYRNHLGDLVVNPDSIRRLLNQRAKLGRLARQIENKKRKCAAVL